MNNNLNINELGGGNSLLLRRMMMMAQSGNTIDWEAEMTKLLDGSATTIELPSALTQIRDAAFTRYAALVSVHIPASVTKIGNYAFQYCSALTTVTYDGIPTTFGASCFGNCVGITDIRNVLPSGITRITAEVFSRCNGLVNIIIPEGVTQVNGNAFSYCANVETITYPSTITSIGGQEGLSFTKFTEVIVNATTPPTLSHSTNSMGAHSLTFPIYVPDASVNAYKNAGGNWANYSSRIKGISQRPT